MAQENFMNILKRSTVMYKRERHSLNRFIVLINSINIIFIALFFICFVLPYYLQLLLLHFHSLFPCLIQVLRFLISFLNFFKSRTIPPLLVFIPSLPLKTRREHQRRVVIFKFQESDILCSWHTLKKYNE